MKFIFTYTILLSIFIYFQAIQAYRYPLVSNHITIESPSLVVCEYSMSDSIKHNLYDTQYTLGIRLNKRIYRESLVPIRNSVYHNQTKGIFTVFIRKPGTYTIEPVLIYSNPHHDLYTKPLPKIELNIEKIPYAIPFYTSKLRSLRINHQWKTVMKDWIYFDKKNTLTISVSLPFKSINSYDEDHLDLELLVNGNVKYKEYSIINNVVMKEEFFIKQGVQDIELRVRSSTPNKILYNTPELGNGFIMGRSITMWRGVYLEKEPLLIENSYPLIVSVLQLDNSYIIDDSDFIDYEAIQLPKIKSLLYI